MKKGAAIGRAPWTNRVGLIERIDFVAMDGDAVGEAEQRQGCDGECAAVAHERKRNAGDGHFSDCHGQVHEDMGKKSCRDTGADESADEIAAKKSGDADASQKACIEGDQEKRAGETGFFCDDGEDEIGRRNGGRQIAENVLRSFFVAFSPDGTGTDGDFALAFVPACAEGIAIRENEDEDAAFPVIKDEIVRDSFDFGLFLRRKGFRDEDGAEENRDEDNPGQEDSEQDLSSATGDVEHGDGGDTEGKA